MLDPPAAVEVAVGEHAREVEFDCGRRATGPPRAAARARAGGGRASGSRCRPRGRRRRARAARAAPSTRRRARCGGSPRGRSGRRRLSRSAPAPAKSSGVEAVRDRDDRLAREPGSDGDPAGGLLRVHDDRGGRAQEQAHRVAGRPAGGCGSSGRPASRRAPTDRAGRRPTGRRAWRRSAPRRARFEGRHRGVDEVRRSPSAAVSMPASHQRKNGSARPSQRFARPRRPARRGRRLRRRDAQHRRPRRDVLLERAVDRRPAALLEAGAGDHDRVVAVRRAGRGRTSPSAARRRRRSAGSGTRGRGRVSRDELGHAAELAHDARRRPDGDRVVRHVVGTTELAPTTAPRPTRTPGQMTTFCPSQAPSPISTGRTSVTPWSSTARDVSS